MRTNRIGLLLGFVLGTLVAIAITRPVQAGCLKSCWSRSCAKTYGYSAVAEPYRVTHAEWTDDNRKTWDGEGVDCSGLVFKSWAMKNTSDISDFYWWTTQEVLTWGKYTAGGFYNECNWHFNACRKVCEAGAGTCPPSLTVYMDAFAVLAGHGGYSENHIGLIYREIDNNYDDILEAVQQSGDQDVRIKKWDWRTREGFRGIKRTVWSSSCSPCPSSCP